MKIDAALAPTTLSEIPPIARAAEAIGFDTLWVSETQHDPFLPGALIAEHTQTLGFGTAVAIAFARSPANLAYTAWDLAQASSGRFILGLGTQVKAHIERRFGMPWPASPVGKLRAQMAAVRAFWQTWQTGAPLNLRGEDYKLTLMTPFFNPGPIAHPEIPIYIAGVNTGLARLAGEAADGFVVHPLHTVRYLQEGAAAGDPSGRLRHGPPTGGGQDLSERLYRHPSGGGGVCPPADGFLCFYPLLPRGDGLARLGGGSRDALRAGVAQKVGGDARAHYGRNAGDFCRGRRPRAPWPSGWASAIRAWPITCPFTCLLSPESGMFFGVG